VIEGRENVIPGGIVGLKSQQKIHTQAPKLHLKQERGCLYIIKITGKILPPNLPRELMWVIE